MRLAVQALAGLTRPYGARNENLNAQKQEDEGNEDEREKS